jgi:NAD(P)-dependent dehydrogenase (short-subunit alcohol dehydrogenase family)
MSIIIPTTELKDKICIVTGANTGIGKNTVLGLASTGASVILVCRDLDRGENAKKIIEEKTGNKSLYLYQADLSSQESIRELVATINTNFDSIDVLINNASLLSRNETFTQDGFEVQLAVNYLAYYLLTRLLLPQLKKRSPSRIINVASNAHFRAKLDLDYLEHHRSFSKPHIYSKTKLADILFTYELSRRLKSNKILVNALHPGVVATNMLADYFRIPRVLKYITRFISLSPAGGAQTSLYLATSAEVVGITGKYFVNKGMRKSSQQSYDKSVAKRLWDISAQFTELPPGLTEII